MHSPVGSPLTSELKNGEYVPLEKPRKITEEDKRAAEGMVMTRMAELLAYRGGAALANKYIAPQLKPLYYRLARKTTGGKVPKEVIDRLWNKLGSSGVGQLTDEEMKVYNAMLETGKKTGQPVGKLFGEARKTGAVKLLGTKDVAKPVAGAIEHQPVYRPEWKPYEKPMQPPTSEPPVAGQPAKVTPRVPTLASGLTPTETEVIRRPLGKTMLTPETGEPPAINRLFDPKTGKPVEYQSYFVPEIGEYKPLKVGLAGGTAKDVIGGEVGLGNLPATPPAEPPPPATLMDAELPAEQPITKEQAVNLVRDEITRAKPIRDWVSELQTKKRGEQAKVLESIYGKSAGQKGFFDAKGSLKGELVGKIDFTPIGEQIPQPAKDALYNMIQEDKRYNVFQKTDLQNALTNVLNGKLPQPHHFPMLENVFGGDFVKDILAKSVDKPAGIYEKVASLYRTVDNFRRAMMVGQVATAMRNAESQGIRYTLNMVDDALAGAMETVTGAKSIGEAFDPVKEDFFALFNRLSKKERAQLDGVLTKFPSQKGKLLSTPIYDVPVTSKVANAVNTLNRVQEYYFRKLSLDAYLNTEADRLGVSVEELPESSITKGVEHALEMTYAQSPKGSLGKLVMDVYHKIPFLTALGNPFPRFWMNSVKFLWDYSPGGFTKLLNKEFRTKLTSDNPHEAYKGLSKAVVGGLMLASAFAIRSSEKTAGEKWYEIKIGEDPKTGKSKIIDTRAFAPYSTYLFLADAVLHPERQNYTDYLQALISINRISGTGLVLVDILRGYAYNKDWRGVKKFLGDWGQQYLGSFTVPFRTIGDALSQFNEQEGITRRTRGYEPFGQTISNIPFARQQLPPAQRIEGAEPYKTERVGGLSTGLIRQATGLSIRTKEPLRREIDRLGLQNVWPRTTGDPNLDNIIIGEIGRLVETEGLNDRIMRDEYYKNSSVKEKKEWLRVEFNRIKKQAKTNIVQDYVDRLKKQRGITKPEDIRKIEEDYGLIKKRGEEEEEE